MKTKNILYLLFVVLLFATCKNPVEELKGFKLNMNGMLADPLVKLNFSTNDSTMPKPQNLIVKITGNDAKHIFDVNGKTDFSGEIGVVDLILGPAANPDPNHPIVFTVEASADDCSPIRQDVYVFSRTQKLNIDLKFFTNKQLAPGVTYAEKNLSFLGKKAQDTISFDFTRFDGVKFVVKYPKQGLCFVRKKDVKFKIGEEVRMTAEYRDDSVWVDYDTIQEPVRTLIGVQIYNGQVAEEYKIIGVKMVPTTTTRKRSVLVGYKIRDTVPVYETRTVFDTIPLSDVGAQIYSQSSFMEFGFYDENNEFIDKPRLFSGVVGFPTVSFYDKTTRLGITPIYTGNNTGRIIECYLPSNQDYKIYASGVVNSLNGDYYYSVKRIIKLNPDNNFVLQPDGKYKFSFKDNFIEGAFFVFRNSLVGCGFADVQVKCPNVDFNYGFDVNVGVSSSYYNVGTRMPAGSINVLRFPSFSGVNSYVSCTIDHPENRCKGNPPLFSESKTVDLCNYVNAVYTADFLYNSQPFISTLPVFADVYLTALIECSGGNYVLPPDITLLYRKLSCGNMDYNSVTLVDGKISSRAFQKDAAYQIRYDRISSLGRPLTIYDTIVFDSKKPEQTIMDESTNYWVGKMKYKDNKFTIDFVFDNRKLKYDIRGCGN